MRAEPLLIACLMAMGAAGIPVPASAAAPAIALPPAAAPTAEQVDALQQRLLASQQTIATLDRQLAEAKNRAVAMDQCRVKNGRLVFIGRELIEGYERRYRETKNDPLQLGRRRFEFELQSLSEAVYDNRADVAVPVPGGQRKAEATTGTAAAPAAAPQAAIAVPQPRSKDK